MVNFNKLNDIIFQCPFCLSRNHCYTSFNKKQYQLHYDSIQCKFCDKKIKLNHDNFLYEVIKNNSEVINKMERKKQDVAGTFLTHEDVGDGMKGDRGNFKILNEGRVQDGPYGERLVIGVTSEEEIEKEFTLSPTNENTLIDKFGKETKKWIDGNFEILLESCSVSKSGLQLTIL